MKYMFLFLSVLLFASCDSTEKPEKNTPESVSSEKPTGSPETMLKRHIQNKLDLNAADNYTYEIYKAEMNRDDVTDWIVAVNLKEKAINDAVKSGKTAKMAAMGFMGDYNYIIFMDGKTKTFSNPTVIRSGGKGKLIIDFQYIMSTTASDFTVDYKIKSSMRRKFYTIVNDQPYQISEEVVYYNYGDLDEEIESYYITYEPGTHNSAKNILVYEGDLVQKEFENPDDIYDANPKIKPVGPLYRRWYYSSAFKKYYLKKGEFKMSPSETLEN